MNRRMVTAAAGILFCGVSAVHAASIGIRGGGDQFQSFDIIGQDYGGQVHSLTFDISNVEPGIHHAVLELDIFGDYDTVDETLMVRVPGRPDPTVPGVAGTPLDGYLHSYHSFSKGPGRIGFSDHFSLGDVTAAVQPDRTLTIELVNSRAVGGFSYSQIGGLFFISSAPPTVATTPEPSTMVLVSLGLACAGCCKLRRRRADLVSAPDGSES